MNIDLNKLKRSGITFREFLLLCLLSFNKLNISPGLMYDSLLKKGFVIINDEVGYVEATKNGLDFIDFILNDKKRIKIDSDRLEYLSKEIRGLFPSGLKHGTKQYWRDNDANIKNNLIKFFSLYGEFTDEQILDATKSYVNKFADDKTLMRTAKYFIIKNNESDLLTEISNYEVENENKIVWRTIL